MAKKWDKFLDKLDDAAIDVISDSGIDFINLGSDDERIDSALSAIHNSKLWDYARYDDLRRMRADRIYSEKGIDPFDIENAAGIIKSWTNKKTDDGKTLTVGDQFYNQYWKADKDQREYWKDRIETELGSGAWEQVKQRMNERLKAESAAKAEQDRIAYLEGKGEGQGADDWAASAWWRLFSGRTKDKMLANKKVEPKDILADIGEDLAMTIPLGAATIPGKIAAAAVVPMASEVVDAAMYDVPTPDSNGNFDPEDLKNMNPNDLAERASFNPIDVAVGTVTNFAAPIALQRAGKAVASKILGRSNGGAGMDQELLKVLKDRVDDKSLNFNTSKGEVAFMAGRALKQYGQDLKNEALRSVKAREGLMQPEDWSIKRDQLSEVIEGLDKARKKGNRNLERTYVEQLDNLLGTKTVSGSKGPKIEYDPVLQEKSLRETILNKPKQEAKDVLSRLKYNKEANDYLLREGTPDFTTTAEEITLNKAKQADNRFNELFGDSPAIKRGFKEDLPVLEKMAYKSLTPSEVIAGSLYSSNRDLTKSVLNSGASSTDLFKLKYPGAAKHLAGTSEILYNLAANKAGNQSHADKAIAPIDAVAGTDLRKSAKDFQQKVSSTDKKNQAKAVLAGMALASDNSEDRKWLSELARNPGLAKGQGALANDADFRKWMLVRGSDILRGTELFRPTPTVE